MTKKELDLIDKGYDEETVIRLCRCTDEEMEYAVNSAINLLTSGVTPVSNPKCIYVGGQPGVGKSVMCDKLKRSSNSVEICMDIYRMFHPHYEEMETVVSKFYKDREITDRNNPGNDIAAFTNDFSGNMTNILIDRLSDMNYNIILEWHMRQSYDVLECMKELSKKGYSNEGLLVVVNKNTSLEACKKRADVMNSNGHIVRRITDYFHQLCIDNIPGSVDTIYSVGTSKGILDNFKVILRNGKVVWDSKTDNKLPSVVINEYYNNVDLTDEFKNNYKWAEVSFDKESLGLNIPEVSLSIMK